MIIKRKLTVKIPSARIVVDLWLIIKINFVNIFMGGVYCILPDPPPPSSVCIGFSGISFVFVYFNYSAVGM